MNLNNNILDFETLINRLPADLVNTLKSTEQDPIWHPEGNIYIHTKLVFEYAQKKYPEDIDLQICAIFHDLGKPETISIRARDKSFKGDVYSLPLKKQKISNIGHEYKCEKYIDRYFHLYNDITTDIEKVKEICSNHLRAHLYVNNVMTNKNKRKRFEELKFFNELIKFEDCDSNSAKLLK